MRFSLIRFDENGRKFPKKVENTLGFDEELLVMSNFSFSPQCFQKTFTVDM